MNTKPVICAVLATFGPLVGYLTHIVLIPDSEASFLGFAVTIAWTFSWIVLLWSALDARSEVKRNRNWDDDANFRGTGHAD